MIKPEDLRIGNLFEYNTSEGWENNIIDWEDISHCVVYNDSFNRRYRPIPLTEKILLDCGFEKQMAWTFRKSLIGNLYMVYYLGEKGWSIGNKNYSDFPCEHLHTLQNVIYDLSKTELIIKL